MCLIPLPEIADHEMKFAIVPHGNDFPVAEAMRLGAAFNQPLQIVAATGISKGDLPATSNALICGKQNNVVMTVLKKAEKEDALILRLLETEGKATTAQGYIDGMLGVIDSVVETDFLERPLGNSTAKIGGSGFSVKIPGHGIATVKVTFKK